MQRNGDSKISEFVLPSNIILRVSVDTGNFVNQKELDYESFQKSSLLNFPSQAVTIASVKNIHIWCSAKAAKHFTTSLHFQMFNVIEV